MAKRIHTDLLLDEVREISYEIVRTKATIAVLLAMLFLYIAPYYGTIAKFFAISFTLFVICYLTYLIKQKGGSDGQEY